MANGPNFGPLAQRSEQSPHKGLAGGSIPPWPIIGDIMYAFFKRARGLSLVDRWNFHYRITRENVAEHSFWVAFYAMCLMDLDDIDSVSHLRTAVLEKALVHDLEEAVTGDCPALVKRYIKAGWSKIAAMGLEQAVSDAPHNVRARILNRAHGEDDDIADRYVKAADIIDVIEYCLHEEHHGNQQVYLIKNEMFSLLHKFKDLKSVAHVIESYAAMKLYKKELPQIMTHL